MSDLKRTVPGSGRRSEMTGLRRRFAAFERPSLGAPLAEAAVEDRHVVHPVHPGDEPRARGGLDRAVVVDHQPVAVVDPERRHPLGELCARRHGGRHRARRIDQRRQVEESGAGNVTGGELAPGVALGVGQVRGRVEHDEIGIAEPLRQPLCRDQAFHGLGT